MKAKGLLASLLVPAIWALVLATPTAAASASLGQIEAAAPALFEEGLTASADELFFATLAGADTGTTLEASGRTAHVRAHSETRCTESWSPLDPCRSTSPEGARDRNFTLHDFKVTITREGPEFLLLGVKHPTYDRIFGLEPQPLRVEASRGILDVLDGDEEIMPPGASEGAYGPYYELEKDTPYLRVASQEGARLMGEGAAWFWAWDARIHIEGVDEDGNRHEETFRTGEEWDATFRAGATRMEWVALTLDMDRLQIQTADETFVHGRDLALDAGVALLDDVTGTARLDGEERTFNGEPVRLEDPPTLVPMGVTSHDGEAYLRFDLRPQDGALSPSSTPLADVDALRDRAAAAAVGGAVVATLAALAYYWPAVRYAGTVALLPLYSRIERSDVLNHEKREEIYRLIQESPGIHAHAISSSVDVGWGTTVYHLNMLEQHGLVTSKRSGRYKRFFSSSAGIGKHKDAVGVLRNETASRISQFVLDHPGSNQKELSASLDLQPSLITWHMKKLEGAQLVKKVKDGRMVRYYAGPAWADLQRLDATDLGPVSATFTTEAETGET